ncbi:TonB-dependent receptor [Rickettsiales bacterium]|nr:TonB-dependent receptor [Rickettsiales bacterium]
MNIKLGVFLCIMAFMAQSAHAGNEEIDELFSLDLEELTVSVASKRDEKISEAPGIVNVLTNDEIITSGARSVFELLERMPGVFGSKNAFTGEHAVALRGDKSATGNYHTLLLINGRPVRDPFTGGNDMNILRNFPLSAIENIELIRGPGSVLYGTNAVSAVVNIITKQASSKAEGQVSASYGTYNSRGTELSFGSAGEDYNIYSAALLGKTEGYKIHGLDFSSVNSSDNRRSTDTSYVVRANYKDLTLNAMSSYLNQDMFSLPYAYPFKKGWQRQNFVDLGYSHNISDNWKATFNGSFTNIKALYSGVANYDVDSSDAELLLDGKITDKISLLVGGTYKLLKGENLLLSTNYSSKRFGGYTQLDYRPLDWLKLIAGVQVNKTEGGKRDFSPRAGSILTFNTNWSAKLLYSEAFRSPYPAEQFINIPGVAVGDEGLRPETVKTYDAQLSYKDQAYSWALTLFKSTYSNKISIISTRYVNGSDIDSKGFTFEGKAKLYKDWHLQGSYTYQANEDISGTKDVIASPNWVAKAGFTYTGIDGIKWDVFDRYVGEGATYTENAARNPKPESYHLLTTSIIIEPYKFVSSMPKNMDISIYGFNLLNEDISTSQPQNAAIVNAMESRAGRSVYGTVTLRF